MRHCYAALSVELPICVAVRYPTLRICGYMARKARPAEEKILCRSPISQRSHVGNLRQTIQGKGVIHKRVETAGVYPLVRPRGVSALPAEVQRKTLRPSGANPPAAVRVPRSAGAEKGCCKATEKSRRLTICSLEILF